MIAATVGVLPAMVVANAWAESGDYGSLESKAAFVEAYVYACQPVEYDFAGAREPLGEAARAIYEQLYVVRYKGSCHDFYFEEVVPRLDADLRPRLPPTQRVDTGGGLSANR